MSKVPDRSRKMRTLWGHCDLKAAQGYNGNNNTIAPASIEWYNAHDCLFNLKHFNIGQLG